MLFYNFNIEPAHNCPDCGENLPSGPYQSLVCPFCGTHLLQNANGFTRGLHLKPISCSEPSGSGLQAFQMLAPAGWILQGGCSWQLDNPSLPAVLGFSLQNPRGPEAFEFLPNLNFTWNHNPLNRKMIPPGSRHLGAEVRPPVKLQDTYLKYILPRYRAQAKSLQLLNLTPLPELLVQMKAEAAIQPGASTEGGLARISYTRQDELLEEDIYAVIETFRIQTGNLFSSSQLTNWFINSMAAFRAPAGQLDLHSGLFSMMIQSFRLNPEWYATTRAIGHHLLSQSPISRRRQTSEIGPLLAQVSRQAREQYLLEWQQHQAAFEQLPGGPSQLNEGLEEYYAPVGIQVLELPAGYAQAWRSDQGEYLLCDDPDLTPGQDDSQRWERLQPGQRPVEPRPQHSWQFS